MQSLSTDESKEKTSLLPKDIDFTRTSYDIEKAAGLRRADGARKLTRLKHSHYKILRMHSSGYTAAEIAEALHCSLSKIYEVTRDPRAQALLGAKEEMLRAEFDQLRERANHAVRRALDADDHKVRLQAARLFYERQGDLEPAAQSRSETAEDVIQRMLNVTFNLNLGDVARNEARLSPPYHDNSSLAQRLPPIMGGGEAGKPAKRAMPEGCHGQVGVNDET